MAAAQESAQAAAAALALQGTAAEPREYITVETFNAAPLGELSAATESGSTAALATTPTTPATAAADVEPEDDTKYTPRRRSLLRIFLVFLSIGCRGFGGPVAQIAMMKQQFVLDEKWMSVTAFNRVYAFYQAVPGPEAAELAVFFGYVSNGFVGGILGGLGFVLPGFCIMLLLSWVYATYGLTNAYVAASFKAIQPAVTAMVLLALKKLADHGFVDSKTKQFSNRLGLLGFLGLLFTVLQINFFITLGFTGVYNTIAVRRKWWSYAIQVFMLVWAIIGYALYVYYRGVPTTLSLGEGIVGDGAPSLGGVFLLGFLAGLLTFGGAYTAVPYIQQDAVFTAQWLTNAQFLDGLALTNLAPTPLVMFVTFVGYFAASWAGAVLMTIGIFLPAFVFSLFGHHLFNRLLNNKAIMPFLEGVTATVIGIVFVTGCNFVRTSITDGISAVIFFIVISVLMQVKGQLVVPVTVAVCAAAGQALYPPT